MRPEACFTILIMLLSLRLQAAPAYFISIDGLQPDLLETLHRDKILDTKRGFSWLLDRSLVVERALPVTSITAPSHVSTITCSLPSRHGIIANEFIRGGKTINGFAAPFASEALWRAAMRQGRRVLSLAYVGADGQSPERSATFGLAYPDPEKLGPGQDLELEWNEREASLNLVLNPKSQELRKLLLAVTADDVTIRDANDQPLGVLKADGKALDIYSEEANGVKRRSTLRLLPGKQPRHWRLVISKASYNKAYPEHFRARLDALNLVWPDYSVKGLKLSPVQAAESQGAIDMFLTDVAVRLVPELNVDLVLFYQPLLDTIGHELQNQLPRPFQSDAKDPISAAFRTGFRLIDRNLDRLLALSDDSTPIALMGDHGMDPIARMVNTAALLRPSEMQAVRFVTSGQLLLLYPAQPQDKARADRVGQDLASKLKFLKNPEGRLLLTRATRAGSEREWQFGDAIWAFQGLSQDWITFDPKSPALFQKPRAGGMHGTANSVASMATTLLIHGANVEPRRISTGSLLAAVPSLTQLMGIKPPKDCVGTSLLPVQNLSRRE